MTFAKKLDIIMNITKTTNSTLARNISVDASLISRFRHGNRVPSKKENYVENIASYISFHIITDYQKAALCKVLNYPLDKLPNEQAEIAQLVTAWLQADNGDEQEGVQGFIDSVSQFQFRKPTLELDSALTSIQDSVGEHMVKYGPQGKQTLVISFLSLVAKAKKPQTLLLFSDEDFSWLADDPAFAKKWAALMMQVIARENRIRIIHTVNRNINEMFGAIRQWLPLYMTGAIEPYYYPKTRDGVFRRTLFIAPDTAAITSSSTGGLVENNANFLYTDKETINALSEEFNTYLSMCRPLMHIFTRQNKEGYFNALFEFENEQADSIFRSNLLSSISMPYDLFEKILGRMDASESRDLLNYQEQRITRLEDSLKNHAYTEIIHMPDMDNIRNGQFRAGYFDMFSDFETFYGVEDFTCHANNIIRLLKSHDNYNMNIIHRKPEHGFLIYAKENTGVIVAKESSPSIIFAINESNLTSAFWDYLTAEIDNHKSAKKDAIALLETLINDLR